MMMDARPVSTLPFRGAHASSWSTVRAGLEAVVMAERLFEALSHFEGEAANREGLLAVLSPSVAISEAGDAARPLSRSEWLDTLDERDRVDGEFVTIVDQSVYPTSQATHLSHVLLVHRTRGSRVISSYRLKCTVSVESLNGRARVASLAFGAPVIL